MTKYWYVADLLFAQRSDGESKTVLCESSQVLFEAPTAEAAYDKALAWARQHEQDSAFRFVGVMQIHSLDSAPCDGCEIGGEFFEESGVWERVAEFVPPKEEIPVIILERDSDTPVGELISEETKAVLRRLFP